MSRILTKRFRAAVRAAVVSIRELAREAGYSPVTLDTYVNRRAPSEKAAVRLADALERRAVRLKEHADRLREAVEDEAGGVDPRL